MAESQPVAGIDVGFRISNQCTVGRGLTIEVFRDESMLDSPARLQRLIGGKNSLKKNRTNADLQVACGDDVEMTEALPEPVS